MKEAIEEGVHCPLGLSMHIHDFLPPATAFRMLYLLVFVLTWGFFLKKSQNSTTLYYDELLK